MNLVTIIWSFIASVCLTLAMINLLVWLRRRTAWTNLLISVMAAATAVTAFCELSMMMAETPQEYGHTMQWIHVPLWVIFISLVLFTRTYLHAGRQWLAWTVCGLRTLSLVLNFVFTPNLGYREISYLQQVHFLGETISIAKGVVNPWMLTAQVSNLLLAIFVVDAAISMNRQLASRRTAVLSSAMVFFILASVIQSILVFWGRVAMPITISVFSLGFVWTAAYEMSIDIQRAAELSDELRKSEKRLRDITSSIGDWVWEVDERGVYTYSSEKGNELFEHVIGKTQFDLMLPEDAERVQALFSELAAKKVLVKDLENWKVSRKGEMICMLTNGVPILTETGEFMGYRGVDKDITERKRSEEVLKQSEAALKISKRDLSLLAGRLISSQEEELRKLSRELHDDLSQRLAVLAIEAGKMELTMSRMPGYTSEIANSAMRIKEQLIKISDDVHTISRQIHPTILDDLGLVRAIESECASVMGRHPLRIIFGKEHVPDEIPNDVALCLYRIVQEGLRNAISHSEAKNCLINLMGWNKDILSLTVTDDGIGFDPLNAKQMPGLGISSMRERVQLVRGELSIQSQSGKGTEIVVHVPIAGGIS